MANRILPFQEVEEKMADGRSIFDNVLQELVMSERIIKGRQPKPTMTIVDSKSVKNAFTAEKKGYDGGKKGIRNKDTFWR